MAEYSIEVLVDHPETHNGIPYYCWIVFKHSPDGTKSNSGHGWQVSPDGAFKEAYDFYKGLKEADKEEENFGK